MTHPEQDQDSAINCLDMYISSKPKGDIHIQIIRDSILAIADKKQIPENSAAMLVAFAFRESLALLALNGDKSISVDDVVKSFPQTIANL